MYMESNNAKEEHAVCYILRATSPVREQIRTSGKNYYRPFSSLSIDAVLELITTSTSCETLSDWKSPPLVDSHTYNLCSFLQLVFVLTTGPKALFSLYVYT